MHIYVPDIAEYAAARTGTVFTRLNRGLVRGDGKDGLDLLNRLSTNAVVDLEPGREATTILTTEKGRVIEVVRILAFGDHLLMMLQSDDVVKVREWLDKYTIMDDFSTTDVTAGHVVLGVYGARAKPILEEALGFAMPDTGAIASGESFGGPVHVVRDIRLNGAGSFAVIASAGAEEHLIEALGAGGATVIGEETRGALRVEVGQPEAGAELTGEHNPLEAGLVSFVSFKKGCYIGQEVIARLDTYDKVKQRLTGIELHDGLDLASEGLGADAELAVREPVEEKVIGRVTSLASSPGLDRTIGLAYVRSSHATPDLPVHLTMKDGEEDRVIARGVIARLPFYVV